MENINCFLGLIKSIPEITLFIKPHPNEEDFSIYEPLTRCKNVVLSRDVDLYKLLNACDIMITKNSTTAMEAAALDKPVIVLNLSRIPDVVDYVKEGIAVGVYKSEDLPPRVKALLKDESELESSRKGYIKKYLYKVDGRSSDRVAEFMANLIN
jgi:surface carbohydrate biosynthesis protein